MLSVAVLGPWAQPLLCLSANLTGASAHMGKNLMETGSYIYHSCYTVVVFSNRDLKQQKNGRIWQ